MGTDKIQQRRPELVQPGRLQCPACFPRNVLDTQLQCDLLCMHTGHKAVNNAIGHEEVCIKFLIDAFSKRPRAFLLLTPIKPMQY